MTVERPGPPQSVPILTEVINWPDEAPPARGDRRASAEPQASGVAGRGDVDAGGQATSLSAVGETTRVSPAEAAPDIPSAEAPSGGGPPIEPVRTIAALDEDALVRRILLELQGRLDGVLEYRVREVLTPILDRAADALVRDARRELSRTLVDLIGRAVAEELRRQRPG